MVSKAPKLVEFGSVAEKLLDKILEGSLTDGNSFVVESNRFSIKVSSMDSESRGLAFIAYYFVAYIEYGLSGNVRFFSVEGDIKEARSGCKVVGFVMTVNSGNIRESSGLKVDKHGIKYVIKRFVSQYYTSQTVGGIFCVPQKVGLSGLVHVLPDEKQVVETILAVARVSKFLANSPCPVFSIDGSFVELSLVGNEETIFQQLLIHELANLRMRNMVGCGENVS